MDGEKEYSDAEIEQIRDECQMLGEIIFEGWMKERNSEWQGGVMVDVLYKE